LQIFEKIPCNRVYGYRVILQWPGLTRRGEPNRNSGFNILWGEHVPTQQDWMKYIILLHPAMQDIVTAEIAKRAKPVQPENPANPEDSGRL